MFPLQDKGVQERFDGGRALGCVPCKVVLRPEVSVSVHPLVLLEVSAYPAKQPAADGSPLFDTHVQIHKVAQEREGIALSLQLPGRTDDRV